jgi:hypothetical protein
MNPGRIPEHGVLGKQVDKIPDLVDTVGNSAVRSDEIAYLFLGLKVSEPGLDIGFGH